MSEKKDLILVSSCLAGLECRYDCAHKENSFIKELVQKGLAITVCPEQMGGLSTPRPPAEQVGNKIITANGNDVTLQFEKGAHEALKIAQMYGIKEAYLKSNSPMCGVDKIYDGSFTGKLKEGDGILTKLLKKAGIKVSSL